MDMLRKFLAGIHLEVRKTIALSLTALFIYLTLKGRVDIVQMTTIYGVIIGFYFGKSTALDDPMQNIEKEKEDC